MIDPRSINVVPLVKEYEKRASRGRAINIGAGRGDNAFYLAQNGFSVIAVEIRKDLTEMIKVRAEENGIHMDVANCDIINFPVKIDEFTFISAINSLNFLSKIDFYEVIEKIKKGLKLGGVAVISLFTSADPMVEIVRKNMIESDGNSFRDAQGRERYYPEPQELRIIFEKDFKILFYIETLIEDKKGYFGSDRFGYDRPHKHAIARIAFQK